MKRLIIGGVSLLAIAAVLVAMHMPGSPEAGGGFAAFHSSLGNGEPGPGNQAETWSEAMKLMQTDTALCEQPYFIEMYELSAGYFSDSADQANGKDFADLLFAHARESGFFTAEEAEGWIEHISAIPGQFVEIVRGDPAVLDSCYNFQVAAVGPPY